MSSSGHPHLPPVPRDDTIYVNIRQGEFEHAQAYDTRLLDTMRDNFLTAEIEKQIATVRKAFADHVV